MLITKDYSGLCPFVSKTVTVEISYLESRKNEYIKGRGDCPVNQTADCEMQDKCPIYLDAPQSIMM